MRRERQEADYQDELADAIVAYLDFADEHADLARQIAEGAATTASQDDSGRVGRTRTLGVPWVAVPVACDGGGDLDGEGCEVPYNCRELQS